MVILLRIVILDLMQAHHVVWLASHPRRTREWLEQRIADGFEIHHCDHNHNNNEPWNLVLIEGVDHHRLHGRDIALPIQRKEIDMVLGEIAYHGRKETNGSWEFIAHKLGIRSAQRVEKAARHYADENALIWPLPEAQRKRWRVHKRPVYRGY